MIFTVPYEKSKIVSIASAIMKNVVLFLDCTNVLVKLICIIAFGTSSSVGCLSKSIVII